MIEISEDRFIELLVAELERDALYMGGVDNWEWCGDSCSDLLDMLAKEYNLEREGLSFRDVARHMVNIGHGQ